MKALVAYGSRYGTSAEIAEEIARVIKEEGMEVDLVNIQQIRDCDAAPYNLVIVGSGIKMGKWTKGSLKFLQNNKSTLAEKKVALFVSCGAANEEDSQAEGQEKYLDEVAAKNLVNQPVATGLFGSVYDPDAKHGIVFNFTKRFLKKDLEKKGLNPTKRHDFRDWEGIRSWARCLAQMFK
jgi:menaquinone-dependent protoporphyrinogen oxidase